MQMTQTRRGLLGGIDARGALRQVAVPSRPAPFDRGFPVKVALPRGQPSLGAGCGNRGYCPTPVIRYSVREWPSWVVCGHRG